MWIVLGLILFACAIVVSGIFLRVLRNRHPDVWKQLGEPGLLRNNDLPTQIRISRYLISRTYRGLPNKRLVLLFDMIRIFEFLVLVSFVYLCVSAILSLFGAFR
jgi:hypothetical protein